MHQHYFKINRYRAGILAQQLFAWLLMAIVLVPVATAQPATPFPAKPLRFIVPFPAGTSPDVVARLLADRLTQSMGQAVIVENRAGAAGIIGAEAAAKSAPDGYTMFLSAVSVMGFNPHIYTKLPYDTLRDFIPVTEVAVVPHVLIVGPSVDARSMSELLSLAKSRPGRLDYASLGVGTGPHLMMEVFSSEARIQLNHIPFKTSGLTELIGGQVAMSFEAITTALPQIRAGKVRAIGISEPGRVGQLPDVPTIAEAVPGFSVRMWQGIFVPARTPPEIVARLNGELVKAIRSPEVQKRFDEFGFQTIANTPEEFSAVLARDYELFGKIIKRLNIRVD